ncbi:methyltransferase domain-containing protein [Acaryochloris sp. IP29b_bin.137]|uniref:methyltransferase domain-containing protein n=1 Tax=Acaryochloris sp. IP29b_bin.137 TaxID=2969217 RepID=UPI002620B00C|nr:methyltransferase domain-containing protein [Acaryochloris sp. IP29b_bin.137]
MPPTLSQQIQTFYDSSSHLWEQVWGEHMHHGYYGPNGQQPKARQQAQVDLIEELLAWGNVQRPQAILDVGCGIGGSSLYLAQKYQATVTGITLSPVQARRAQVRAQTAGLSAQTTFQVVDALNMPFPDGSFDLVWSLESGEHMPDKTQFLQECCRVLKPEGRLLIATWCHRPTPPALTWSEQRLLNDIYRIYYLPYVISLPDYAEIAQTLPLTELKTADWSVAVAPFWDEVIRSALNPQVIWGILNAGLQTLQGSLALSFMSRGYRQGVIRYGLLRGTKLTSEPAE